MPYIPFLSASSSCAPQHPRTNFYPHLPRRVTSPTPRPPEASQSGGLWGKRDLYTEAAGRATPAQWLEDSAPPGWAEPAPLGLGAVRRWKRSGEKAEGCANGPRGGPARQAGAGTGEPVVRPPSPLPPPSPPPPPPLEEASESWVVADRRLQERLIW